jgi:hypothetical protein
MARYSIYVRPDLLQLFWTGMQSGDFITDAVVPINSNRRTERRVLADLDYRPIAELQPGNAAGNAWPSR